MWRSSRHAPSPSGWIHPAPRRCRWPSTSPTTRPSRRWSQAALAWAGRVDIMVNNAGIAEASVPTWEMPLAAWQRTIDIDLTGVFHGCRAVLPTMLDRGLGPDHQHLLDRRQGRQAQPGRVRGGQGGRRRPDQVGRLRGRAARDPRQRDHAGHDRAAGTGPRSARRPRRRPGSATRSAASASRRRSRRWSPGCHRTNARSRPARSSTSRAAARATDATCGRRSSGSRSPTRRPRRPGRVPSGRRSCCGRRRSRR